MRIAVDARYLKRRDVGISLYLRGLIARLIESGAEVTLVTDEPGHARDLAEAHQVRAVALPCASGFLWEQVALPRWLRCDRPEVVLAGANYGLPLVPIRGVRRLVVVHDLIPLRLPRLYVRQGLGWLAKYLLSLVITLCVADAVITPSEATARDVRRLGRRRVWVRMPDLPAAAARSEACAPPGGWPERYLLYNGGRDPRKNVPRLIEAFARYRGSGGDHHLVLMGRGYEEHAPLVSQLGIADAVSMPGFVDDRVKAHALSAAAAVVYPSTWEGFGLPLVEAFAAGIPVVAGRGGAQTEIGGAAALYVDVDDVASIAAGMQRAVEPSARARALVDGPRRLAELGRPDGGAALLELLAQPPLKERSRR
jgi:glycosyltransferase involved in cell wall biosynthesis